MNDELPTSDRILRYLRHEAQRPLKAKELARALDVDTHRYRAFRERLRGLVDEGRIYRQRKGRYAAPANLNLLRGTLQVTKKGDGFVVPEEAGPKDVYVPARHLGSAVEGDVVLVRIERRRSGRNPEGRVIRVEERAWTRIAGHYSDRGGYAIVRPTEPPLGHDVFIPRAHAGEAEDGDIVAVEILEWGEDEPSPVGRVDAVLGPPDAPGVDVLAIVIGHGLPLDFPEAVQREAGRVARAGLREGDLAGREDFRDRLAFTIDPADARDHDDALSLRALEGDMWEVGVHIADVSWYVKPGSQLDLEARERGTSVYLVDRVLPMLPEALSSDLCSLRPGEDRLTLSVVFEMDGAGVVRDRRFVRGVIRSGHRLSYEEAQALLEAAPERARPPGPEGELSLTRALTALREIARGIRRRRLRAGAIDFDLPESKVRLDEAGEPLEIRRVDRLETHRLIEDLMIRTNEEVATLALEKGLPLLYRIHEPPDEDVIRDLRELAATFGHALPAEEVRPGDLARLVEAMRDTPQETLISMATLRSLKQARYAPGNVGHFGLASAAYAHFTSPIRRYPDLVAHRAVVRWLGGRRSQEDERELRELGRQCSARERRAEAAERESVEAKKIEYMERHLGDEVAGTVSGVTAFGLFVLLDLYLVEGLIRVSSLVDDYYQLEEERHALVGRRTGRTFRLGDPVTVRIVRVDRELRQIDLELLEPSLDRRGRGG